MTLTLGGIRLLYKTEAIVEVLYCRSSTGSQKGGESLAVATRSVYRSRWFPYLDLNFGALPADEALLGRRSRLGMDSLAFYLVFLLWFWLSPLRTLCLVPQLWARTRLEYVQCRDLAAVTFSWAWLHFLSFHQSCLIIVTNQHSLWHSQDLPAPTCQWGSCSGSSEKSALWAGMFAVLTALPVCDCSHNTCRVGIWCQKHKGVLRMCTLPAVGSRPLQNHLHWLLFIFFFFFNPFMLLWISPKSNLFVVAALGALMTAFLLENMPSLLSGQPFILISQREQICSRFLNVSVLTASTACSSLFLPG